MEFPTLTAAELVAQGECHPSCMVGQEEECTCRCDGAFHGVLASSVVPERPRCAGCSQWVNVNSPIWVFDGTRIVCRRCMDRKELHGTLATECHEEWHDMWDHADMGTLQRRDD